MVEAPLPAVAAARPDRTARRGPGSLLGLPAATRRSATRVVDRFGGRTYDEVAEYDAGDRLVSLQRFDTDGRLLAAVRFGWRGDGGPALAGAAGRASGRSGSSTTLGLEAARHAADRRPRRRTPAGPWPGTGSSAASPCPGDGLRIQLWPDGSVHGLARSERALAPRPAVVLDAARARSIAEAQLDGWFPGAAPVRDVSHRPA